jgi:hypothetical protein
VWCTLIEFKVTGSIPFEEPKVTGNNFLVVMENTALHRVPMGIIFVRAFVDTEIPDRWIKTGDPLPDLSFSMFNSFGFFFSEFLNDTAYRKKCKM